MTPSILMGWLNEYVGAMADTVADHDGVVLELTGDGVLAVFGIPVPRTGPTEVAADARDAVRCALAMGEALAGSTPLSAPAGCPRRRSRWASTPGPWSRAASAARPAVSTRWSATR